MQKFIHSVFIVTAVGLLVLAWSGCSPQAKKARHLAQADRYFADGKYDEAEIEYKNVLQLEALNPQAISRLGVIYFNEGSVGRAAPFLLKGSELQPDNLDLRLKLGLILLGSGKAKEAHDAAEFILSRKPDDPDAPMLLAEAAVQPNDIAAARQRLQQLSPPPTQSAPVLVALGMLDLRQGKSKDAEASFQKAHAVDPKSSPANSALGLLYKSQNDLPHADEALAAAAAESPLRSGRRLAYAQFKIQTGAVDAGRHMLEEMTQKTPDYLPARLALAQIAANDKKYDEADAQIAKVLAKDAAHPEALLLRANIRLAKGENDLAVKQLENMLQLYPQSSQVLYELGTAYLTIGDVKKATTSLTQAITLTPNYADAIVLLASINVRIGDPSTAIAALKQLLPQRPDLAQAWLLLANAYRAQGNAGDAIAVYGQMEKLFPGNPQTSWLLGQAYVQQNKKTEARQAFTHALELAPDYLPAVEQLVTLDLADKQYPAAHERVAAQIAKDPKQAGPYLLQAQIFLAENDTKQAETALLQAVALQPELPTSYFLLARLYLGTHQEQKALANLQTVVAKNPKDTGALMMIGVLDDQKKDYAAARDSYEKLLAVTPKFPAALNNLAYLYSEHFNQPDKAQELAQRARDLLPSEPHIGDTLGWILYRKHQYPRALSLFQESADKLPDSADIQFHLGMAHYMMGHEAEARSTLQHALELDKNTADADEIKLRLSVLTMDVGAAGARAALEKALANQKDDPIVLTRLAAVYKREGAADKAISTYQAALQASPANVDAMLNLIQLYAAQSNAPKALETAKAARNAAPNDPDIAHALGRLTFQSGDYPHAMPLLQEAARKEPDDAEIQYDFAESAYSGGRVADAEAALRHALDLSKGAAGALPERAEKARHILEMMAYSANPAEAAAAVSKINQALKADPADVPALMALGTAQERNSDAAAAKQTYEKALARYPDFSPAQQRLTLLYAANPGDDQKAFELATKARAAFPDDPELAKAFGIIVYRRGDFTRAVNLLGESATKRANDAEVMFYLGMTQSRLKNPAASKRSLQRALDLNLKADLATEARKTLAELK